LAPLLFQVEEAIWAEGSFPWHPELPRALAWCPASRPSLAPIPVTNTCVLKIYLQPSLYTNTPYALPCGRRNKVLHLPQNRRIACPHTVSLIKAFFSISTLYQFIRVYFDSTVSIEPIDSGTSGRGAKNKMSTTAVFVESPRLSAEHIRFGVAPNRLILLKSD
jgi:hypothetical protein